MLLPLLLLLLLQKLLLGMDRRKDERDLKTPAPPSKEKRETFNEAKLIHKCDIHLD